MRKPTSVHIISNFARIYFIKNKNVEIHTLSSYDFLLEKALEIKYITENEIKTLKEWKKNPSEWNSNSN